MSRSLRNIAVVVAGVVALLALGQDVWADNPMRRPKVLVHPAAQIKDERITLGSIATITSTEREHEALIAMLKSVDLGEAPPALTRTTILGANVLSAIQAAGIQPDTLAYSIPNAVVVERTGRILSAPEVLASVREKIISQQNLDLQIRDVTWQENHAVPIGETEIEVRTLGEARTGKLPLQVEVLVNKKPEARFLATALVDDWREVPVLQRTLERGRMIAPEDIQTVRLNVTKQPADIISNIDSLIGKRTKSQIQAGEVVRAQQVDLPPTINKGKRITMTYKAGALSATASGVALDDGIDGATIRVKNESSAKILKARVIGPESVEVE